MSDLLKIVSIARTAVGVTPKGNDDLVNRHQEGSDRPILPLESKSMGLCRRSPTSICGTIQSAVPIGPVCKAVRVGLVFISKKIMLTAGQI